MAGEQQLTIDESTTDPVALQALFNKMEGGEEPAPVQTDEERQAEALAAADAEKARLEAEAAAAAKAAETDTPAADATAAPKNAATETDPDGVATKDGKHIIPYSVLQAEREKATTAVKELETTRARLLEMETAAKANPQGVKTDPAAPSQANAGDMSEEDLAILKEDFPTVYKGIMAMRAQAAELEKRLGPVQESVEKEAAARKQSMEEQVQEGIDATPKLAHIKATSPEQFELAAQFDKALRTQPEWQGKSFADRFAKVVEMVEAVKGEIVVPGAAAKTAPPAATKTPDQLKAEAQAIAAEAAKSTKTGAPGSLSDFPSGKSAAADELAKVENMTTADLSKMFAKMTPEQMDAYLLTL